MFNVGTDTKSQKLIQLYWPKTGCQQFNKLDDADDDDDDDDDKV